MSITISTPPLTPPRAPKAAPAPLKVVPRDTSLIDAWEATRRGTQEKILNDRLETADRIRSALAPLMAGALSLPGGMGARPMAGMVDTLAREMRGIIRDMGRELNRQRAALPEREVSSGFHQMLDKAELGLRQTTGMVVLFGSSDDKPLLPGRMSAREIAAGTADHLQGAWTDLDGLRTTFAGLRVPRVNITA